jgi:hypothetical protein
MISDVYIANETIYRLLENGDADANFSAASPLLTNMTSKQELIDTMNRIQQQFMLATGMIVTRATISAVVGQAIYDLPVNNIRPRRITWQKVVP